MKDLYLVLNNWEEEISYGNCGRDYVGVFESKDRAISAVHGFAQMEEAIGGEHVDIDDHLDEDIPYIVVYDDYITNRFEISKLIINAISEGYEPKEL